MRVSSLTPREPSAICEALVRRGLDPVRADAAARGLSPVALFFEAVATSERDLLASVAHDNRVECLTGEGWALLAGSAAAMAGITRPGYSALPMEVAEAAGHILQGVVHPAFEWGTARGTLNLERPVVVGVINVTPDSFSDGGQFLRPDDALRHAERLLDSGAGMLDIGAQSTRPGVGGAESPEEEWQRLDPVLREITREFPSAPISIDTVHADTGRRALAMGAAALNDVSGLRLDPALAAACADHDAGLVLMHSRGALGEMASYDLACYDDPPAEVASELLSAVAIAEQGGVAASRIALDPGLGFAKRPEHNYAVLRGLSAVTSLGFPVMVGPSRKRFLGEVTGADTNERDNATAAVCVAAYAQGATLFRVHDVGRVREALQVAYAVRNP